MWPRLSFLSKSSDVQGKNKPCTSADFHFKKKMTSLAVLQRFNVRDHVYANENPSCVLGVVEVGRMTDI